MPPSTIFTFDKLPPDDDKALAQGTIDLRGTLGELQASPLDNHDATITTRDHNNLPQRYLHSRNVPRRIQVMQELHEQGLHGET